MMHKPILGGLLAAALLATPVLAADPEDHQAPPESAQPTAPAASQDDSLLRIDVVRLARGYRVSRVVGKPVYNETGEKIGIIDDLIVRRDDRVMFGVVSVGGFLGIGDRLIAVPYRAFSMDTDGKLLLAGITKEDLKNAPAFRYASDKKEAK
jgi:hypothetical protein